MKSSRNSSTYSCNLGLIITTKVNLHIHSLLRVNMHIHSPRTCFKYIAYLLLKYGSKKCYEVIYGNLRSVLPSLSAIRRWELEVKGPSIVRMGEVNVETFQRI